MNTISIIITGGDKMDNYITSLVGTGTVELSNSDILLRIGLSLLLSAIIGFERSSKRHSAGLRTFIIVSLAATTAAMIDLYINESSISIAVIIGIALLSGYSIFFSSRGQIKGLTTSMALWSCGIIGFAVGLGKFMLAFISWVALLCGLSLFPMLERYLKDKSNHFEVHLELKNKADLQNFTTTIRRLGMRIDDIEMNPAYRNSGLSVYTVLFTISSKELKKYKCHSQIIEALRSLDYIAFIDEVN